MKLATLKIPGQCKTCGNPLSKLEMEHFLESCEETGRDPFDAARATPPGIHCSMCQVRLVSEMASDETHPLHAPAKKFVARMISLTRRDEIGLKLVAPTAAPVEKAAKN